MDATRDETEVATPTGRVGRSTLRLRRGLFWLAVATGAFVSREPAPTDLLMAALIAVTVLALVIERRVPDLPRLPLLGLAVLLLANVVSLSAAGNLAQGLRYMAITVYLMLAWMATVQFGRDEGESFWRSVVTALLCAALLTTLPTLYAFFAPDNPLPMLLQFKRGRGFFKDPNVFGPFLIPAVLFALNRLTTHQGTLRSQALPFAATAVLAMGVVISESRAAWGCMGIALAIFIGLAGWRQGWRTALRIGMHAALIAAFTFGAFAMATRSTPRVTKQLKQRAQVQWYDADRFKVQQQAARKATLTPLGLGPGQTEAHFNYATHNLYLRVAMENGVLGMVGLAILLVAAAMQLIHLIRHGAEGVPSYVFIVAATLVSILVNSVVIDSLHWRHFWLFLALPWTVGVKRHHREREAEEAGEPEV